MSDQLDILDKLTSADYEYKYGFESQIEEEIVAPGISEETIRLISEKGRAGLDAPMAIAGVSPLANDAGAALGECPL